MYNWCALPYYKLPIILTYTEIIGRPWGNSSPNRSIDRTSSVSFSFPTSNELRKPKARKVYRNPILLAQEWRKALINGEYSSQADLARKKNISRARVTQVLNLLKLESNIIMKVMALGDPLTSMLVTERKLRNVSNLSSEKQRALVSKLLRNVKKSANQV